MTSKPLNAKKKDTNFSSSFFGGDEDDAEKDTGDNAFTFSLLGQLKDSLVTYDNSLKGFLDIASTPAPASTTSSTVPTPAASKSSTPMASGKGTARDRLATIDMERKMEEQREKFQQELEDARTSAASNLQNAIREQELKRAQELAEIEARASKLAKEKEEMSGSVTELEAIRDLKMKDEKKIEKLLQGWAMEREQGELVKMAMVSQHKQELETVRTKGREKMVAMQAELVHTMEMLEKMYSGWQSSLEDALTEMRAERKVAVDNAKMEMELMLKEAQHKYDYLNEQYQQEHTRRKQVHNKLVEMMGNIRVICRVRPINKNEIKTGLGQDCTAYPEEAADENIIIKTPITDKKSTTIDPNDPGTKFEFDAVFGPQSTQLQVFNELKPLVTSCMDGFSVTIFAYGQTGSGKTYTMEGGDQPDGLCYRAFQELFNIRDQRCESGRMAYSLNVSMLEIYNEQVRDLLGGKSGAKLDIRATATGSEVPGLSSFEVHTPTEVHELMIKGNASRAVGGHSMNERSSRSHSCIRITITGENLDKGTMINSKLYLIDLAGSERVAKTDATGDRLKEAQNINKSLSALGNVMQALSKSKSATHVPFRDSKLTYLLQDSLSGGSKVLMVVNISPAAYNHSETLSSLGFASRCRAIELGKATKNEETGEAAATRREMAALKKEVTSLKKSLEQKTTLLHEAEKKEMSLSQKLADANDHTNKKSADSAALVAEHQSRLDEMMNIKIQHENEIDELKEMIKNASLTLEGKEEDLIEAHKNLNKVHEELAAAKEAKVAAEGQAMGMGIELKNITRELELEREKNAKSETSTISSYKAKLSSAEQKVKDAGADALKASQEVDAVKEMLAQREKTIVDLEDELGRVRSEYSALLTKITMQRFNEDSDVHKDVHQPQTAVHMPSNVVDQPLLTTSKLNTLRSKASVSRIPSRSCAKSPETEPILYKPENFKTLSDTLAARANVTASPAKLSGDSESAEPRGPSRARSEAAGQLRETDSSDAWKSIEERRKKMEELAKMTFEERIPSEDDEDDDRESRRSTLSLLSEDSKTRPLAVAVEEAALAMSESELSGDSPATDAEFAGFQAQFVGGVTLGVLGSTVGSKTKRRSKVFTIRFLPKKGLTLCWGKRDTIVFSGVNEIICGGSGRSSTPSRGTSRTSWSTSTAPVDKDKVLVIRYSDFAGLMKAKDSPRSSRDSSVGDLTLCLEAKSKNQRDHIARCMRRLSQQEKERSSFLVDM